MDEFKYKSLDKETGHHLIDQIKHDDKVREDLEFDYLPSDLDLVNYMWTVMDDDTSLYIIPAKLVEGSPIQTGYFIY